MILADVGSDWSSAAAIMTFVIPVGLFVIVATILYFQYTRPHKIPGHRDLVPAGHAAVAAAPATPAAPDTAEGTRSQAEGTEGTA